MPGLKAAHRPGIWKREVPKTERVRRGERMTARARASAGNGRGGPRPGRRLMPRPLARERCRARHQPTPGGRPPLPQAGGCSPLRDLRHRASQSARMIRRLRQVGAQPEESAACGFSPQTRRSIVRGAAGTCQGRSSSLRCGRSTLTEPRPRVPRSPDAPVGLRGRTGEAATLLTVIFRGKQLVPKRSV